jgi:GNAT superfamily N-acetyltransferase
LPNEPNSIGARGLLLPRPHLGFHRIPHSSIYDIRKRTGTDKAGGVVRIRTMRAQSRKQKSSVYAGSFDPLTVVHMWMIDQGRRLFDLLAELNHQLIRAEGHRNPMTVPQLDQRMRGFIEGEYRTIVFERYGEIVTYALYREAREEIYLRQLFVVRDRRRQGIGRQAMEILRSQIWPKNKRLTVEVLAANTAVLAFWRAVGYVDHAPTLEIMP